MPSFQVINTQEKTKWKRINRPKIFNIYAKIQKKVFNESKKLIVLCIAQHRRMASDYIFHCILLIPAFQIDVEIQRLFFYFLVKLTFFTSDWWISDLSMKNAFYSQPKLNINAWDFQEYVLKREG